MGPHEQLIRRGKMKKKDVGVQNSIGRALQELWGSGAMSTWHMHS